MSANILIHSHSSQLCIYYVFVEVLLVPLEVHILEVFSLILLLYFILFLSLISSIFDTW